MGTILPVSIPTKNLSVNLAASATGAVLYVDDIEKWDGTNLASGDFGTQAFAVLRNSANTQVEFIEIDPATIASSAITILKRGLDYAGGQTANVEDSYNWTANDTKVELGSHIPQLLRQFADEASSETIAGNKTLTGTWTFSNAAIPRLDSAGTWGAGTEEYFVTKRYADALAIAGSPDASTTQKGLAEEATQAEVEAGTAAGSAARLFVNPSTLRAKRYHSFAADAGASDAYAITVSPTISAYTDGDVFVFEAATVNTGNATLNVNSVGAKNILKHGNVTLADGDIKAGSIVMVVYDADSDAFMLQTPIAVPQVSQGNREIYAASSSGNDTYAVTYTPAPAAYITGGLYLCKPDTANTGAATLNVNSLGAKTIKKFANGTAVDLSTGDIAANQPFACIYDGTDMILVTASQPRPLYATGQTTQAADTTGSLTIAHGLGVVPRMIRITAVKQNTATNVALGMSVGTATSTTTDTCTWWDDGGASLRLGQTNNAIIDCHRTDGVSHCTADVSGLDATNITLNFSVQQNGGVCYIQWEAYA